MSSTIIDSAPFPPPSPPSPSPPSPSPPPQQQRRHLINHSQSDAIPSSNYLQLVQLSNRQLICILRPLISRILGKHHVLICILSVNKSININQRITISKDAIRLKSPWKRRPYIYHPLELQRCRVKYRSVWSPSLPPSRLALPADNGP